MTEHIHLTKTRSQIKNCKIAQTQWEYFFNYETFLMKGLALLLKSFVIVPHVYSLGVHCYLLIPEMNKNLALCATSKGSNSLFPLEISGNV